VKTVGQVAAAFSAVAFLGVFLERDGVLRTELKLGLASGGRGQRGMWRDGKWRLRFGS
jgi:hypothetical protein